KGVSATGSLLDCAVKYGIIDKKGAWFSYGEEKVGQGRDNAKEYLEQNPDFARDVEAKLRQRIFPGREFPVPKAAVPVQKAAAAANPAGEVPAGLSRVFAPEKPASGSESPAAGLAGMATAQGAAAGGTAAAGQGAVTGTAAAGGAAIPRETGLPVRQGPGRPRKVPPAEAPAGAPSAGKSVPSDALF
ncbi:MAG: recombinase RecA, partial [Treponema sp.]|nr:recombinase RecA [Treponema sp.]